MRTIKAAVYFICSFFLSILTPMASARDKKMKKGETERKRVENNAKECKRILALLGLAKKTSKIGILKAALEFLGTDVSVLFKNKQTI